MNDWTSEVTPILGDIDIMVFAQNSDIKSSILYTGSKYEYLKSIGFNYFLGFCTDGDAFTFIADEYVRQGRLMVTGTNIKSHESWFKGIFETEDLLVEGKTLPVDLGGTASTSQVGDAVVELLLKRFGPTE